MHTLERMLIGKRRFQFFHQRSLKKSECFADRSAQDHNFRIVSVKRDHEGMRHLCSKTFVGANGGRVSGAGSFKNFLSTHPALPGKKLSAAVILNGVFLVRDGSDLAGPAIAAVIQTAIDDDASTQAGAKRQTNDVTKLPPFPVMGLAQGEAIRIVVDVHRDMKFSFQCILQMHFLPRWNILNVVNDSTLNIHNARNTDPDRRNVLIEYGPYGGDQLLQHHLIAIGSRNAP